MVKRACPECGEVEAFFIDSIRGEVVCPRCGLVLRRIVNYPKTWSYPLIRGWEVGIEVFPVVPAHIARWVERRGGVRLMETIDTDSFHCLIYGFDLGVMTPEEIFESLKGRLLERFKRGEISAKKYEELKREAENRELWYRWRIYDPYKDEKWIAKGGPALTFCLWKAVWKRAKKLAKMDPGSQRAAIRLLVKYHPGISRRVIEDSLGLAPPTAGKRIGELIEIGEIKVASWNWWGITCYEPPVLPSEKEIIGEAKRIIEEEERRKPLDEEIREAWSHIKFETRRTRVSPKETPLDIWLLEIEKEWGLS